MKTLRALMFILIGYVMVSYAIAALLVDWQLFR